MADKKISQLTGATTPLAGTEVLPVVQSGSTVKVSVANLTAGRAVDASSVTTTGDVTSGGAVSAIVAIYSKVENKALTITDAHTLYRGTPDGSGWEHAKIVSTRDASVFTYGSQLDVYTEGKNSGTTDTSTVKWSFDSTGNLIQRVAAKGIDFSANTHAAGMTSELLNWYEEGTWTPEYAPETGAFTSITYGFNTGRYIRIGGMVWVTWSMRTSALTVGTASGTLYIKNLPFTSRNVSPGAFGVLGTSVDFNANNPFAGAVAANDNKITLYRGQNNVVNLVSDLSTGGANNFTAGVICYQA